MSMKRISWGLGVLALAAVLFATTSGADDLEPAATKPTSTRLEKVSKRAPLPEFTSDREKTALQFVSRHHDKLTNLLEKLKEKQPKEYQKAIRDLYQTSQSLKELEDKDPKQYAIELDAWKLKSQSELLAARLRRAPDADLEKELKLVLAKQLDNQISRNTTERDRLAARLKRVEAQLEQLQVQRDATIQSRYDRLVQSKTTKKAADKQKQTAARKSASNKETNDGSASPDQTGP